MTTYPMHFTDNANTWQRIALLARLYWPGLKPGFIIYAVAPLLLVFLSVAFSRQAGFPDYSLMQWPISLLLLLSPIMLTRRDYRDISRQLPVTAAEKLGFLLLTFWVAVPLVICLSSYIGQLISVAVFGSEVYEEIKQINHNVLSMLHGLGFGKEWSAISLSFLSDLAIITIVLYYVVKTRKNRTLSAFLSMIIVGIAMGLFLGLMGALIGFCNGFWGAADGISEAEITTNIVEQSIKWVIWLGFAVLLTTAAVYLFKLYRRLRNSGF